MILKIKKLHVDAILPKYATKDDAGMDLFAIENIELAPMERGQIGVGIAMEIPEGYVGLVWDKSGLSHKFGIKTLGGVIDSSYRGESIIGVINLGTEPYTFEKGHKIAQMLIQKIEHLDVVEVDNLSESDRGEKGFGSTGK